MTAYVVDASVAAKWFLQERFSDHAQRLLDEANELHVPDFFFLEMDNVLCKWIRRGAIDQPEAELVRGSLARVPFHTHAASHLRDLAYALANRLGGSVYDCVYLALAQAIGEAMVTADRRLYRRVAPGALAEHVLWVEDVP